MKTPKVLVVAVVLLIVLVALNMVYSFWRAPKQLADGGNTEPNRPVAIDRVKNDEERARMERYIAELQESMKVIKSFPGPSGEIIDCVDVYSQPALKRPGMEDHKIQFAPSSVPLESEDKRPVERGEAKAASQLYLLTGESCPEKTIPIRRLTMETLARFETLDDFFKKQTGEIQSPQCDDGASSTHEYAHAVRYSIDNWGGEAIYNVWSPFVDETDEFSLSQMWIMRGAGDDMEAVEAGWQKCYDLYGDWRSRLFIYYRPDAYGSGGCYNLTCGAFVQVDNSVYIGGGFTNYSSEGGTQWEFKLAWIKDHTNGHWWLRYQDIWVGYYPRNLFDANGIRDYADRIDFGGEIVNTSPDGHHTRTDMGSGNWPYEGFGYAAYQRAIRYVDTSYYYRRATGLNPSATDDMCYDIDLYSSDGSWGEYFYFGGSGYNTYCP